MASAVSKIETRCAEEGTRKSRKALGVRFADEIPGGRLADILEVEACKKDILRELSRQNEVRLEERADVQPVDPKWCEDLLRQLESTDSKGHRSALLHLDGIVLSLALSPHGFMVVQQALEVARRGEEQEMLVMELHGHVCRLTTDPYGSEVLQSCLELLPPAETSFIADELKGQVVSAACHEAGQEVVCRLFEYLTRKETIPLTEELLRGIRTLIRQAPHVVQHMVEYGIPLHQVGVCKALAADFRHLLQDPATRDTLEFALRSAGSKGRTLLLEASSQLSPHLLLSGQCHLLNRENDKILSPVQVVVG